MIPTILTALVLTVVGAGALFLPVSDAVPQPPALREVVATVVAVPEVTELEWQSFLDSEREAWEKYR